MTKIVVSDIDFEDTDLEQALVEGAGIEFARFQDRTPVRTASSRAMATSQPRFSRRYRTCAW